eukprot:GHVP01010735.1.p1 GENE.GHVP01010735.1~~GHVP01010735.1.p1  ORF type:complete len:450 (-),score=63.89 GHVP01010735.1:608-1957(-)
MENNLNKGNEDTFVFISSDVVYKINKISKERIDTNIKKIKFLDSKYSSILYGSTSCFVIKDQNNIITCEVSLKTEAADIKFINDDLIGVLLKKGVFQVYGLENGNLIDSFTVKTSETFSENFIRFTVSIQEGIRIYFLTSDWSVCFVDYTQTPFLIKQISYTPLKITEVLDNRKMSSRLNPEYINTFGIDTSYISIINTNGVIDIFIIKNENTMDHVSTLNLNTNIREPVFSDNSIFIPIKNKILQITVENEKVVHNSIKRTDSGIKSISLTEEGHINILKDDETIETFMYLSDLIIKDDSDPEYIPKTAHKLKKYNIPKLKNPDKKLTDLDESTAMEFENITNTILTSFDSIKSHSKLLEEKINILSELNSIQKEECVLLSQQYSNVLENHHTLDSRINTLSLRYYSLTQKYKEMTTRLLSKIKVPVLRENKCKEAISELKEFISSLE